MLLSRWWAAVLGAAGGGGCCEDSLRPDVTAGGLGVGGRAKSCRGPVAAIGAGYGECDGAYVGTATAGAARSRLRLEGLERAGGPWPVVTARGL
jgi:hypothetical protein